MCFLFFANLKNKNLKSKKKIKYFKKNRFTQGKFTPTCRVSKGSFTPCCSIHTTFFCLEKLDIITS